MTGSNGLYGVPAPTLFGTILDQPATTYWYVLGFFVVGMLALRLVSTSAPGVVLRGIRDSEDRMRALGYRTTAIKLGALVFAGAVAGLAGGLLAAQAAAGDPGRRRLRDLRARPARRGDRRHRLLVGPLPRRGPGHRGAGLAGRDPHGHGPLALGLLFVLVVYLLPTGIARIRLRRAAS